MNLVLSLFFSVNELENFSSNAGQKNFGRMDYPRPYSNSRHKRAVYWLKSNFELVAVFHSQQLEFLQSQHNSHRKKFTVKTVFFFRSNQTTAQSHSFPSRTIFEKNRRVSKFFFQSHQTLLQIM